MPLNTKKSIALTAVLTLAIGGGATLWFNKSAAAPMTPPTPQAASAGALSVAATITRVIDKDTFEARAHTWVGQYVSTTVCTKEPKPPCTEQATLGPGEKIAAGNEVHLSNIRELVSDSAVDNVGLPGLRPRQERLAGPVPARITKLLDGDTVEVTARIWPRQRVVTDIRMGGIDTPEKEGRAKCDREAKLADKASAETKALLEGRDVLLYDLQFEKYGGRLLGTIRTLDGTDAAENLISKNLARPYKGKTKQSWCGVKRG